MRHLDKISLLKSCPLLCSLQLGPLRNVAGTAEIAGCMSAAGLVLILSLCLAIYGDAQFQGKAPAVGVKTLSGRSVARDPLFTSEG
jgi:photosystem I subunit 11